MLGLVDRLSSRLLLSWNLIALIVPAQNHSRRLVRHEILACVSPLMTLFSSWFQLLLFDFLVNYAESVTFTTSLPSPDYDFWHDSDTDEWILCFVFINCFRLISRSQSELNTLDWSLWSLVSTMYLSLTVWLFNFRSLYEWELLFYT